MNHLILIVEDEENDVYFLNRALKKAGVPNPTHVAEDGQFAIDYLRGAGEFADRETYPLPSIIFLDLKLPRVHGLQVLEWVRTQVDLPPIPIIVLTSSAVDGDIQRAYRLGANSYVVKPSQPEQLTEIMCGFRDWWLRHLQLPYGQGPATIARI